MEEKLKKSKVCFKKCVLSLNVIYRFKWKIYWPVKSLIKSLSFARVSYDEILWRLRHFNYKDLIILYFDILAGKEVGVIADPEIY